MGTTVKAKVFKTTKPDIYRVKMYLIHNRVSSTVATKITLNAKQIYKTSLKIRDHQIIDLVEDLEKRWRFFISELGIAADTMTIQQLVDYLKTEEKRPSQLKSRQNPLL